MDAQPPAGGVTPEGEVDAELIAQTLAGHSAAFDELVRRYHRQAVAVAYRLLGSSADAADVSQDAFLRAYRSLGALKDRRRFGPWLMRIVSNLSLNARRARKRGPAGALVSLDEVGDKVGPIRSPDGEIVLRGLMPADNPASAELRTAIRRSIDALPEKQRLALILFSIEGMPQKEVAAILDCSIELVKWNVFQARKKLREALTEYL